MWQQVYTEREKKTYDKDETMFTLLWRAAQMRQICDVVCVEGDFITGLLGWFYDLTLAKVSRNCFIKYLTFKRATTDDVTKMKTATKRNVKISPFCREKIVQIKLQYNPINENQLSVTALRWCSQMWITRRIIQQTRSPRLLPWFRKLYWELFHPH